METMRTHFEFRNKLKIIFFWFAFNASLSLIISSLITVRMRESFFDIFLISFMVTQIISTLAAASGYACGFFKRPKTLVNYSYQYYRDAYSSLLRHTNDLIYREFTFLYN